MHTAKRRKMTHVDDIQKFLNRQCERVDTSIVELTLDDDSVVLVQDAQLYDASDYVKSMESFSQATSNQTQRRSIRVINASKEAMISLVGMLYNVDQEIGFARASEMLRVADFLQMPTVIEELLVHITEAEPSQTDFDSVIECIRICCVYDNSEFFQGNISSPCFT